MKNYLLPILIFITLRSSAQNVIIPDANFKAYLVGNSAINTNGNTEIEYAEAIAFTGSINCSNLSINDLTGIEAFTGLTILDCGINQLTSLDVSQNTALIELWCNTNQLTALNVNQLSDLQWLYCQYNQITILNVDQNTNLVRLYCNNNQIQNLDVSLNTVLTRFYCKDNQLNSLNLANGNNLSITHIALQNNANLTCIKVDDAAHSSNNWTDIDSQHFFNENCSTVGIDEVEINVSIYPNPSNGIVRVESDVMIDQIIVQDITGKQVLMSSSNIIDLGEFRAGIYILQIHFKDQYRTVKVVKE